MATLRTAAATLLSASLLACAADDSAGPAGPEVAYSASGAVGKMCQSFRAQGVSFATGPTTFSGSAQVWIGGVELPVSVVTELTGPVSMGQLPAQARGAQVVTTSHQFDFGNGNTLLTQDRARLIPGSPAGVFKLISTLRIVASTGTFADVVNNPNPSFTTDPSSTMDLRAWPTVEWSFDANICGYDG